ncbi:hypothetical protein NA56DRAFT_657374 [Hyaloscypha hepaticicola]|uniref:Uncharacterized protein n=1 Tax=Hyaloscypha hepaticicola TaxID=2082293 RepID=A0A2J6QAM7_9HELO|nr:hypothetical protein NA56DRAFT_657374 [Hyaloscypha hepaticicola]
MAKRDQIADRPSPRSSKQRHDSGYAPLASDEKNEDFRALSPVKNRMAERVPEHARWICIPLTQLLSWKDVQNRGKDAICRVPGNHSFQDHAFDRSFYAIAPNWTVPRISRFEDTFEQMRKQVQLKHRSAPSRISFSIFDNWKRKKRCNKLFK